MNKGLKVVEGMEIFPSSGIFIGECEYVLRCPIVHDLKHGNNEGDLTNYVDEVCTNGGSKCLQRSEFYTGERK